MVQFLAFLIVSTIAFLLIARNVTIDLSDHSGNSSQSGVEEVQQEPINNHIESSDWKEYYAITGKFKMQFPTYPEQDVRSVDAETNIPALTYTTYSSVTSNGKEVYLASVAIYPNNIDTSPPETVLNNVVKRGAVNMVGTLVSSDFTTFNNYTAVDYTIKVEGGFLKNKSFLIGQTLYTLAVGSAQNDFPAFNKFVNSFQLLGI